MAHLITPTELARWTSNEPEDVAEDPFAEEVLEKVSEMVRFLGGQPDWEIGAIPFDARMVALNVAKRTYSNPDQEVSSTVGPISSRLLDVAAMLMDLTASERRTLTKYNSAGDPDEEPTTLWVQRTSRYDPTPAATGPVLYVGDDQQVNLGDEREWMIPMFNPDDPGGEG